MILLDTHVVMWLAEMPENLSSRARGAIRAAREQDGVGISDKSLWELAMLVARGRVTVKTSLLDFLQTVERSFTVFPVTGAIAERAVLLSEQYPRDPADRLIGATALVHGFQLVTRDDRIRASGEVPVVW